MPNQPGKSVHSALTGFLTAPCIRLGRFSHHLLFFACPSIWNALCLFLVTGEMLQAFYSGLKTHLLWKQLNNWFTMTATIIITIVYRARSKEMKGVCLSYVMQTCSTTFLGPVFVFWLDTLDFIYFVDHLFYSSYYHFGGVKTCVCRKYVTCCSLHILYALLLYRGQRSVTMTLQKSKSATCIPSASALWLFLWEGRYPFLLVVTLLTNQLAQLSYGVLFWFFFFFANEISQ